MAGGAWTVSTTSATTVRSTIRRLRETIVKKKKKNTQKNCLHEIKANQAYQHTQSFFMIMIIGTISIKIMLLG